MNSRVMRVTVVALSLVFFALAGCSRPGVEKTQEAGPGVQSTTRSEVKLPPKFGIYYESTAGPVELATKPAVAAANPSFLIYLQNVPGAAKLRLRFGKASGGPFIIDAGTVTNSESDKPKTAPKPGNYQNILVLSYGEDAGVFEPQVAAVDGQNDLFKATYANTLKPGEYFAFYFIDQSKGQKPWEEASFKFAGQFTVK